jgi:hypothetical protein
MESHPALCKNKIKIGGTNWINVHKIKTDIGIRKIASNKIKDILPTIGLYQNKCEEKWERLVKKRDDESVNRE